MVLLNMFFTQMNPRRDHQQIVLLFILSLRKRSSSSGKILLQIFLYEDLSTLSLYICRLYFPPECQQDRTLLRNQYY